jgi:drug/metabolite transporter (DMT)-like permease
VIVAAVGSRDEGAVSLRNLAPSLILGTAAAVCISWQTLGVFTGNALNNPLVGLLAAIAALVSWSAYAVINARCLSRLTSISAHNWNLLTGVMTGMQALALLPIALLTDAGDHTAKAWTVLAGVSVSVALIASIAGNALWNRMSRLLPLTMVGSMFLFETLFAILYGFLWEWRHPQPLELLALGLVVISVLTCVTAHRERAC